MTKTTINPRILGATTMALDLRQDVARVQRAALHYAGALLASGTDKPAPKREAHRFMQENGFPVMSEATAYRDVANFGKTLERLAETGEATKWSVFADDMATSTVTIDGAKVTTYALAKVPAAVVDAWRAVYRAANVKKETARVQETVAVQEEEGTAPKDEPKAPKANPWRALADALADMGTRVEALADGKTPRDDDALADALAEADGIRAALAVLLPDADADAA